jgi:hypothetical protein
MRYTLLMIGALAIGFTVGARPRNMPAPSTEVIPVNCVKECSGDPDCIACCRCVQSGKPPQFCCF